jgi:hypothetical protein
MLYAFAKLSLLVNSAKLNFKMEIADGRIQIAD